MMEFGLTSQVFNMQSIARSLRPHPSRLVGVLLGLAFATALAAADVAAQSELTSTKSSTPSATATVQRLFESTPQAAWFTTAFLTAVPLEQVGNLLDTLVKDFGTLRQVEIQGQQGFVQLERAQLPVTITLDSTGRIAGLRFGTPQVVSTQPTELAKRLRESAVGRAAVFARVGEDDWVAFDADVPMAVGSAFKLAILQAYEDAVRERRLLRDEIVRLQASDRSLPSGVLQTLAPATPVTPELLAGLMTQHSDNTATDALLRVVGREAVEHHSPRNRPFLSTSELFKLTAPGAAAQRTAYANASEAERRSILATLAASPLPSTSGSGTATWGDAEWFFTARELCGLLLDLRSAPALNGVPNPLVAIEGWPWTAYKGGSEYGVLNLTAAGITPDGKPACAVLTANGAGAQNEERLAMLFAALFRSLGAAAP